MATKLYDVCVKTGSYTNNQNEQKNRYENVGTVMQNDDGSLFLLMKTTFSPAGVPNPDNRDTILCSFFDPQNNQQQLPPNQQPAPQQGYQQPVQQQGYGQPIQNGYAQNHNPQR